jgi:hypothetical protein
MAALRRRWGGGPLVFKRVSYLIKATLYSTLTALKRIFIWLAGQPGTKVFGGLDDPLFPATKVAVCDSLRFEAASCRSSTHAASERRWRFLADNAAVRQRSTKLGRRILVMSTC